jgi:hypothetical protein
MSSWRSNIKPRANTRRHLRFPVDSVIRILWHDGANAERVANAKVVEVSVSGVKLRLEHPIPVRSLISCNDRKLGVSGAGTVRYCMMVRGKYEVGVEFNAGTGWRETAAGAE